jgi:hypothetical protein
MKNQAFGVEEICKKSYLPFNRSVKFESNPQTEIRRCYCGLVGGVEVFGLEPGVPHLWSMCFDPILLCCLLRSSCHKIRVIRLWNSCAFCTLAFRSQTHFGVYRHDRMTRAADWIPNPSRIHNFPL